MSDYRYAFAPDLWVQDDHIIDGRDMPDELKPDGIPDFAYVELVRDDAGEVIGARVWDLPPVFDWQRGPGRWVPIA